MLCAVAENPNGLENLKLLYGLNDPDAAAQMLPPEGYGPETVLPPLPGATDATIVVINQEEQEYQKMYNDLVAKGANKLYPKQMRYLMNAINTQRYGRANQVIGAIKASMFTKLTPKTPTPLTDLSMGGEVPPPVADMGMSGLGADAPAAPSPKWVIGGLLLAGALGLYSLSKKGK